MNAITATRPQPIDARRMLEIQAYICLIEQTLATSREFLPGRAATVLLQRLDENGVGAVLAQPNVISLTMFGIRATATGSAIAVLRNWQRIAKARIAEDGQ